MLATEPWLVVTKLQIHGVQKLTQRVVPKVTHEAKHKTQQRHAAPKVQDQDGLLELRAGTSMDENRTSTNTCASH